MASQSVQPFFAWFTNLTNRQTDTQADTQTYTQTDTQTGTQTGTQTDHPRYSVCSNSLRILRNASDAG